MLKSLLQNTQYENPIKGATKEEVVKELKNILKNGEFIKIGKNYDNYDLEAGDTFIQIGKNKKIYYVDYYSSELDLEENGKIISLDDLKIHIDTVADLTLKDNIEDVELETWLND